MTPNIHVRLYEELNDFLPEEKRKHRFDMCADGVPTLDDLLQILHVPVADVEMALVNGDSVGLEHEIRGGEYVSLFPVFERFDVSSLLRIRPVPLRRPRFFAVEDLRRLALGLRLRGFDASVGVRIGIEDAARISESESRVLLIKHDQPLARGLVSRIVSIHEADPRRQLMEVLKAMDLLPSRKATKKGLLRITGR